MLNHPFIKQLHMQTFVNIANKAYWMRNLSCIVNRQYNIYGYKGFLYLILFEDTNYTIVESLFIVEMYSHVFLRNYTNFERISRPRKSTILENLKTAMNRLTIETEDCYE